MSSSTPRPRAGAEEIASRFEPSAEATALMTPGIGASDFVAALVEKELWGDAAGFVGQWLGKRDAVMWACLAARKGLASPAPPKERAALVKLLQERRETVQDPRLKEILDDIDLRAQVELAKLGR